VQLHSEIPTNFQLCLPILGKHHHY
jgi:hypothetical protein